MALISEWMEQCGKKVLDNAGIVRDAIYRQKSVSGTVDASGFVDGRREVAPLRAPPERKVKVNVQVNEKIWRWALGWCVRGVGAE